MTPATPHPTPTPLPRRDRAVHAFFRIGVIAKVVDGALEVIGGVALLFVDPARITGIVRVLTQHELSLDPHDLVAGVLVRSVQHLSSGTELFAALFLFWHGAVKVGLVLGLLRNRMWAYPTAITAFGAFLVYQLYRYALTRSDWLVVLSILDVGVIALTWLEYRRVRGAALGARRTAGE